MNREAFRDMSSACTRQFFTRDYGYILTTVNCNGKNTRQETELMERKIVQDFNEELYVSLPIGAIVT